MSFAVSRREFLKEMAAQLAVLPLACSVACRAPPPEEWQPLARRAAGWFHGEDLGGVRLIGARFLAHVGRDHDAVRAELGPTLRLLRAAAPGDDPGHFEAALTADFAALNVRDVEGWTLAATEAHLAALVELYELS